MYKVWLIIKREYLERVRTKSFVLSTVLVPVLMGVLVILPQKLATMHRGGVQSLVVVTTTRDFGEALQAQLAVAAPDAGRKFNLTIDLNPTPAEREVLTARVLANQIDGFVWAPDEALAAHRVTYVGRNISDFIEMTSLRRAMSNASMERQLAGRGMKSGEVRAILRPLEMDAVRVEAGKQSRLNGTAVYVLALGLVIFLYTTLLMYGITVMRSVIEEKSNRLVEVLLAAVTARQLMIGKIIGVGAVGLTQVAIWAVVGATLSAPALLSMPGGPVDLHVPMIVWVTFPVFFLLGYLLYSATFAALGAAVNTEQEAQHFQLVVTAPIITSLVMMSFVLRQPNAPVSVAFSLFPFTAPILMYLRIVVQPPPIWQIVVCVGLLAFTIAAVVEVCARIYQVGILMYGKRPSLPEILKWARYT